MKYYEFNNEFEYYALIGAYTVTEAKKFYIENICDIENDNDPVEVSEDYMIDKVSKVVGHVSYDEIIDNSYGILLSDGSLI